MSYRLISAYYDDNNTVFFVYRNEHGKSIKVLKGCLPYIYVKKGDKEFVASHFLVRNVVNDTVAPDFAKVYLNYVKDVYELRYWCKKNNIAPYEADIPFTRRIMIDKNIKVGDMRHKKLYVDIETDDTILGFPRGPDGKVFARDQILSISMWDDDGKKYYKSTNNERELLHWFKTIVEKYDVLVAWNGEMFDFPYLKGRCIKNRIWVKWRHLQLVDFLKIFKRSRQQKLTSFSLDNVGEVVLGLKKLKRDEKIITLFKENPEKLKQYNERDVEIMFELEKKTHLLRLWEDLSVMGNIFLSQVSVTSILDTLTLMKVKQEKLPYRFPSHGEYTKETTFKGGHVKDTIPGLHKNVIVLDFKSLYNRVISLCLLSPECFADFKSQNTFDEEFGTPIKLKEYVKFAKTRNPLLPTIQKGLVEKDEYFKSKMLTAETDEKRKEYGMQRLPTKFLLKGLYGQMGSEYSRYYTPEIAGTITGLSRWFTMNTIKKIEDEFGYKVCYADTDSSGIILNSNDDPIEVGNRLCKILNDWYNEVVERFDGEKDLIVIKFEKVFNKVIFVGDETKGTKKRYVALKTWDEGRDCEEIVWTGLESVRSDWTQLSKTIQRKIVDLIFDDNELHQIVDYLKEERRKVLNSEIERDNLVISQSLTQPIEQYKNQNIPHIRVAKRIIEQGGDVWVGKKIQFIVVENQLKGKKILGVSLDEYEDNTYDITYYWNKKFYPPSLRILKSVFPQHPWDKLLLSEKFKLTRNQKSLLEFN